MLTDEHLIPKGLIMDQPQKIIYIGEFGHDPDEEGSLLLLIALHLMGVIELVGVIANRAPAIKRARLARGTLDLFDLQEIPVLVGTDCNQTQREDDHVQFAATYLSGNPRHSFPDFQSFWGIIEHQPDSSIAIVCASGLTDMYELLKRNTQASYERLPLFRQKVARVSIMGGVAVDGDGILMDEDGRVMPAWSATNNQHDEKAEYVYTQLQRMGVELHIVSKHAAYAAKVRRDIYDGLRLTNHPAGYRLSHMQRCMIQDLWERCNLLPNSPHRDGLPPALGPEWFAQRFCGGADLSSVRATDSIWEHITYFFLYDQLSVMLAIPHIAREHFDPVLIELGNGGSVYVVGVNDNKHQVIDGEATAAWLIETMTAPLKKRSKRV